MQQKSKRQKQAKLDRLLMNAMPKSEQLKAFFTIEPPEPYHFPLEETFLQGIQLVEQYCPEDANKLLAPPFMPQRLSKYKGKLVVQGRGGVLVGSTILRMQEVSAASVGNHFFVTAHQNRSLGIYTNTFQPVKEIKHFSEKKLTLLRIVDTPAEFEGLVLLSSTGSELNIHRLEKGFFNSMSCKLTHELFKSKEPILQIVELPRRLKQYIKEDATYLHVSIYAVLSASQIWVIKVDNTRLTYENFCDVVYSKEHRTKSRLSSVSWGQRSVGAKGQPHLVLTYSFGNTIYMSILHNISRYMESETKVRYEWIESEAFTMLAPVQEQRDRQKEKERERELLSNHRERDKDKQKEKQKQKEKEKDKQKQKPQAQGKPIAFCQHIKRNEILLVLEDGEINIFYTGNMDVFEKAHTSHEVEIISYQLQQKMSPMFIRTDQQGQLQTYCDSFAFELSSNEIIYLAEGKVRVFVYCNWKQICDLLRSQKNYSSAMNFLIAMYRKSNRFDLGASASSKLSEQLSEYIENLTMQYLNAKLPKLSALTEVQVLEQLSKQYSQCIDLLLVPVELLVNTYEFIFLFQQMRDLIIETFSERVFYKMLQPFIMHAKIKYIPENELKQTLDFYVQNNQLDLVERLAIYFDLDHIEKGIVIQCCINNNLAVSLAFICTQGNEGEFVTPFIKFWGIGQSYRKQGEIEYAQLFAIRALWYVRLCLQRNMALKEFTYEKYGYLISILTQHFFTRSMIVGLLEIRVEACLQTLTSYFTIENASIVNSFCKLKIKESQIPQLAYIRSRPDNVKLEMMLAAIFTYLGEVKQRRATVDEQEADSQLFIMLLSRIIIYKSVKFTKEKYLSILKSLIQNYRMLDKINYGLEGDQMALLSEETPEILASEYINKVLTLIMNEQTQLKEPIEKEEMSSIYYCSRQVELIELQAHINFMSGHYGACIDVYIRAKTEQKERVFRFLENAFKNLDIQRKKKQRRVLEKEVKEKISQLIALNAEKSIKIIQIYLPDSQEQLINALEDDGGLQLEYLQQLVNTCSAKMTEKAVMKYVQRMCQLKPNQLLEALKKHTSFPVEECLKLCEQFQIYDCMEYLYERMGNIEKSVQIATLRIDEILSNRCGEEMQMEPYIKIAEILNNAVEVCIKNHSESVWESLFDAAVALFRKYKNNPEFEGDVGLFYEMNAKIMYEMMRHCNVEHSVWLIQNKYKSLDMGGSMKTAFIETLSNFSYSENILFSANSLTRGTLAGFETDYALANMSAYAVAAECRSCGQSLNKTEKCIGFYCGHNYHKECIPASANYCISCLSEQQNQFNMYLNNVNHQNHKFKLDRLMEESEQLRKANLDTFHQSEQLYEQKQLEEKKEGQSQRRMTRMLDFDQVVKIEEDSTDQIEQELMARRRPRRRAPPAEQIQAASPPPPSPALSKKLSKV